MTYFDRYDAEHPYTERVATAENGWADWSARVYGPAWEEFKDRYWRSWWTRKACFWCRTRPARGRRLELNHLHYPKHRRIRWFDVRPMCRRCHRHETWMTRQVRPGMGRSDARVAHAYVTYVVRWALYVPYWCLGVVVALGAGAWVGLVVALVALWLTIYLRGR